VVLIRTNCVNGSNPKTPLHHVHCKKNCYFSAGLKLTVPDNKSRNIPEVVLVRRWAVGVLGIWKEGVGWVKGDANGVSLQAT
jgi:hypothetical protein